MDQNKTLGFPEATQIAQRFAAVLRADGIAFQSLYLFGSTLHGSANANSDIDVAVFLDQTQEIDFAMLQTLMKLRRKVDLRLEPHVFAANDSTAPLALAIRNTGFRIR